VKIVINLTPFIPLALKGEGKWDYVREASPLFDSPCSGLIMRGCLRGASAPIFKIILFPLSRGRGYRG